MSDKTALKALRKKVKSDRDEALKAAMVLAERGDNSVATASELEFALGRVEQLDRRLSGLPRVEKIREPDLYERRGPYSFFADVAASVSPLPVLGIHAHEAQARLLRHQAVEERRRGVENELARRLLGGAGLSARTADHPALSERALSTASGAGGEFTPPKWLVDQFASVVRAAAPLSARVKRLPLPDGTLEVVVPRLDFASGIVAECAENVNDAIAVDPPTDDVVTPVRTFAGQALISQALHDRSQIDELVIADAGAAYAADLEAQLITGTGVNGQLLGLLNVPVTAISPGVPGAVANTYTATTPTPASVVAAIATLCADVADARERPPTYLLMLPRRFFWLSGSADGSGNEPAMRSGTGMVAKDDGGPVGPVAGLPVLLEAVLPSNLGAGTNQDVVVAVRPADLLLLEEPAPRFSAFAEGGTAAQLSVVLQYHRYVAALTSRYPSAIGTVTGTGFVIPTGF